MMSKYRSMSLMILTLILIAGLVGIVSADKPMKVIAVINVSPQDEQVAELDFSKNTHAIKTVSIPNATVKQNHQKKIAVTVNAVPRPSGGITVELFCEDNTGRFMPIWGGSISKTLSDWDFTETDIQRENIDGCYFAVIDSTAEAAL